MLSMVLDKDSDVAVEAVNLLLLIQQWGVSLSLVASLCHCQHTAQEFHFNRSKHPKYARFDWHKCLCFFFLHKKFYSNANKSISISSFIQLVFSLCTLLLCMSCVGLKVKKLLHKTFSIWKKWCTLSQTILTSVKTTKYNLVGKQIIPESNFSTIEV